ncbi:MAG: hypothetical protein ACFFCW_14365 [Candidatus Hodarchaeota archaeon]
MNTQSLSQQLLNLNKAMEVLCKDIEAIIKNLRADHLTVQNNHESLPMLTYFTLMDISRYCSELAKKIEMGAVSYRMARERIEEEAEKEKR